MHALEGGKSELQNTVVCVSVKTLTVEPGVVVHSFNPRSWEAEAGESLW